MPYITREDGQNFVIPSYREIIFAKQKSGLKKEVLSLSQNYGDHITINRKGPNQYEVAFSPDSGYSLGETVWHHFGRPADMIYCEAIPDTTEAILVIVKDGSVYLDGSFPVDSIPEELVIFLTQQNNFDIYLHGDVPISQEPEDGKFSFDESSVSSFTVLEDPVFNSLPLLKAYQFQLVEPALKAAGVGAFPIAQLGIVLVGVVVAWMAISFLTTEEEAPKVVEVMEKNPYEAYQNELKSPDPADLIAEITKTLSQISSIDGWMIFEAEYKGGSLSAQMRTAGNTVEYLMKWADEHNGRIHINDKGVFLHMPITAKKRPINRKIYPLTDVMAVFIDRIYKLNPTEKIGITRSRRAKSRKKYKATELAINLKGATPVLLNLVANRVSGLPLVLTGVKIRIWNETYDGKISLKALGS